MSLLDLLQMKQKPPSIVRDIDSLFDDKMDASSMMRQRIWFRNLLYYCGEQYLEFVRSTKTFRRRTSPEYVSTPVSNEIREYVRSVKSMLMNQKLVPRIYPNTNEKEDKDAADLGRDLLIWMDTINDNEITDEKEKLIIWMAVAGTGFLRTYPDNDAGLWFMGKDGKVRKTGDVVTENVIPFNVYCDPLGDSLNKKRWMGIQTLKSKEWVEDTFNVKLNGSDDTNALDYNRRLIKLVGQVSPWKGFGLESTSLDTADDDLVVFKEVEFKPYKKYPNGRYVVTCRDELLVDVDRLPIKSEKDKWYYTLTDFHFNYVPGRFWSDSGVDDLISPQNAINEIDRSLQDNRRSLGRTRVLMPGELSLQKLTHLGDNILVLKYDPMATQGQTPQFAQGIPLPQQVIEERMIHKVQIQEMGGDPKNVLKGQAPSAHASGIMTETLRETAERGHAPDIERFNRAMERVYKKRLLLAREVYTEERTIKIAGKGKEVQIKQFKSSDLHNNTDVRMEIDSGLATTNAGKREVLMSLVERGAFGDISQNTPLRHEVFQRFGLSGFTDQDDVDTIRAEGENGAMNAGMFEHIMTVQDPTNSDSEIVTDDPLFKYDNHQVHYEIHRSDILKPEFKDLDVQVQAFKVMHCDLHHTMVMAAQKAQQDQMMQMEQAKKAKPQEGGQPNAI